MFKALTKQSEWPFQLFFILQFGVETCIANVGAGPAGWKWGKFQLHDCSFVWAGLGWAGLGWAQVLVLVMQMSVSGNSPLSTSFISVDHIGQKVGSKILLHSLCMVASAIIEDAKIDTNTAVWEQWSLNTTAQPWLPPWESAGVLLSVSAPGHRGHRLLLMNANRRYSSLLQLLPCPPLPDPWQPVNNNLILTNWEWNIVIIEVHHVVCMSAPCFE